MTFDEVIEILYAAHAPEPENDEFRSARTWFTSELVKGGIKVSRSTVHDWCREGVPPRRRPEVDRVIQALYARAVDEFLGEIATLTPITEYIRRR